MGMPAVKFNSTLGKVSNHILSRGRQRREGCEVRDMDLASSK